jgi:hypothetical protein
MNPTGSCDGKQFIAGRHRFAVLQTVGQHAQRERLGPGQRVCLGFSVSQAAGQIHDLGNPAAIRLALDFDFQIHSWNLNQIPDTVEFKTAGARCGLENAEKLEQLRALENGIQIAVVKVEPDSVGVDTPEDVEWVERYLNKL